MKIGKSYIEFKTSIKSTSNGERCTLQNVPFWRLYSRDGDQIVKTHKRRWRSVHVYSFNEIVQMLEMSNISYKINAYPRFSDSSRQIRISKDSKTDTDKNFYQYQDFLYKIL